MKKLFFLSMALLMVTAISVGPFGSLAAADNTGAGLFTDSSLAGSLDTSTAAVRSRYVDVHFDALGAAWAKPGDVLELNLFNDVSFKAVLKKVNKVSPNGFAYVGRLRGIALSSVNLVVEDGLMAANIVFPGGAYQVRYAGNGVHVVYEVDQSAYPPEAEPIPVDLPADAGADDVSADALTFDDGSQIDVLVVYTDDARLAAGGTTAMNTLIDLAISETNTSYDNSGITQQVRLVHKAEVSYDEASFDWNTTLTRLTNTSDGYMDNVHTLRDTYNADEVVLFVANGDYCGMAWLMTTVSNAFKTSAFALVNWDCATGYFSFGHELGHNMGARHDWYVDDAKNSPYTYNKGYVNPGATTATRWRTVMAYNNECSARGFSCTRIQYWSNPLKTYGGLPMGVASGSNSTCTTGNLSNADCDADNHLVLNNTAYTVANFRASTSTCPLDEITKDQSKLNLYREFRDKVLSQAERGREYTKLYYKHSLEVTLLLLKDSSLKNQARRVLERTIPEIRLILGGKKNDLSPDLKNRILSLLKKVSQKASPKLKIDIERLMVDIEEGRTIPGTP